MTDGGRWLARTLPSVAVVMVLVSVMSFSMISLVPGDAATLVAGDQASAADVQAARVRLGLDRAWPAQYWDWVSDAVRGDFGMSLYSSAKVTPTIFAGLPPTASMLLLSIVFATIVGVTVGAAAALRRGSWLDHLVSAATSVAVAVPGFVIGALLLLLLAVNRDVFPASGYVGITEDVSDWFLHLVLPSFTLSLALIAEIARQTRAGVLDVLGRDYVRTAHANGLGPVRVLLKHVARNAAIPVVTVIGLQITRLIGGAVVIEAVFGLQGIGSIGVNAVNSRDLPVVQGLIFVVAIGVIVINVLVDASYAALNPRLRT